MLNLEKCSNELLEMYKAIWQKALAELHDEFFTFNGECQKKGSNLLKEIRFHENMIKYIDIILNSRG